MIFVTPDDRAVRSGRAEHDNWLGALNGRRNLDVARLGRVHARVDDSGGAQNVAGAVPAALAMGGAPEGGTIDEDLHVSESSQAT